jgi:hypothetical protein
MADGKQVWQMPFAAQGMGGYNAATPIAIKMKTHTR